jgi:hypothetical protein
MWHAWEITKAYRVLMGNPEEKRSFGRPRHKWKLILKYI